MSISTDFLSFSTFNRPLVLFLLAVYIVLSGCAEKQDPGAYVERGEKYYAEGELDSAVIEFKNALNGDPNDIPARLGLALVYLDIGNGPAAEKELQRAVELGVSSDEVLVPMTRALIMQSRYDEVTARQQDMTNLPEAEKVQYYTLLGDAYLLSDSPEAANQAYDAALSLAESAGARLGKARVVGARGDIELDELQQILEDILADHPDFALAWVNLGDMLHLQGRHEEAEKAYTKAISLRYNNNYEYYRRALVRIGMGSYEEAKKDAEVLKGRSRGNPRVSYLLGLIEFKKEEFPAAQSEFEHAVKNAPGFMNAVFYLGASHFYQGHTQQAIQYLSQYHRKFPGSTSGAKLLAGALYQSGDYNRARKVAMPMLEVMPDDPFLLNLMGNIYIKQGNVEEALSSLQRLKKQRPDAANIRTQIGLGLMATGNYAEGTDELEHAVKLAKGDHEGEMTLVMVYLRRQQFDKAMELAKTLSDEYPENPSMLNLLGVTQLAAKQENAARNTFLEALKLDPGNPGAAHNLAGLELRGGNVDDARGYYRQVLDKRPAHLRTLLKLAQLEASQNNREKSLEWLKVAIEQNPKELSPRLHLAREYLREAQPDKASALLTPSVLEDYRDEPALLTLQSDIQLAQGDAQGAIVTLENLTKLAPRSAEAQYLLAKAHAIAGNDVQSRAALQKALALDPNHLKSRITQMRKLVAVGEVEQAKKILDVMVSKYPDHPEIIAQQAWFSGQGKDAEAAVIGYQKAYELTPVRELAIELSKAHLMNNDPSSAIAVLEGWVAQNPSDAVAWSSLGNIYLLIGEEEKAVSAYKSVVELDPDNVTVLNNLAWIIREKEPQAAIGYAKMALEINPEFAAAMDTLGVLLLNEGETGKSLELLRKSVELNPANLDGRYHLTQALVQSGDKGAAQKMLQELLAETRDFSQRKNAEELLNSLGG